MDKKAIIESIEENIKVIQALFLTLKNEEDHHNKCPDCGIKLMKCCPDCNYHEK